MLFGRCASARTRPGEWATTSAESYRRKARGFGYFCVPVPLAPVWPPVGGMPVPLPSLGFLVSSDGGIDDPLAAPPASAGAPLGADVAALPGMPSVDDPRGLPSLGGRGGLIFGSDGPLPLSSTGETAGAGPGAATALAMTAAARYGTRRTDMWSFLRLGISAAPTVSRAAILSLSTRGNGRNSFASGRGHRGHPAAQSSGPAPGHGDHPAFRRADVDGLVGAARKRAQVDAGRAFGHNQRRPPPQ
jgi:hypothetical protein